MQMKLFGRTQTVPYPMLEACIRLHDCGMVGAELCLENQDINTILTESTARSLSDALDGMGMERSLSWHADYVRNDTAFESIKRAIALTPSFGSRIFVCGGTRARGEETEWHKMVSRTRDLAAQAEASGVILAKEFEPGFVVGSTEKLLRLFEEVPYGNLQANLDLGHVFLCDPDPMAAIAGLEGRIAHCHIENMARGVHRHLPPWEGDMDLSQYLSALASVGFDGPIALDLYDCDYLTMAGESVKFFSNL
jgi:sugar phosphate isomerase/epimerase